MENQGLIRFLKICGRPRDGMARGALQFHFDNSNPYDLLHSWARREAEAELAFLNHAGCIDAIMTDDCDALIFGARTVINYNHYFHGHCI